MASFSDTEQKAYKYLFDQADNDDVGVLTGDKAVGFFSKSKLPIETLGEIWQLSDNENTGFLTSDGFAKACRLIAHAQQGETVSEEFTRKPAPLPVFEGISIPGVSTSSTAPANNTVALAPVTTQDKSRFMRLFLGAGPVHGLLDGDKARDIFVKSNLPYDQLGHIWNLADTQQRGALDATDFVIGMHVIDLAMSGHLPNGQLPSTLPAGFYESAIVPSSSAPAAPLQQQNTGTVPPPQPTGSPVPRGSILKPQSTGDRPIPRQNTGQKVSFGPTPGAAMPSPNPSSPGSRAFARGPPPQQQQVPWDISPEEKARSDGFFDQLDTQKVGFVQGDQAVPFFLESQLPEAVLAQVWDLSDISKQGKLSKDEFAVAMRLINNQLDGKAPPTELPTSLIPPSFRGGVNAQAGQPAPTVERDLFSLMDEPAENSTQAAPPQAVSPQVTGARSPGPAAALSPQGTGQAALSPQGTGQTSATPAFSSSVPQPRSQQFASRTGAQVDDFFGDDGASKINNDSAQVGQLRNEYNASSRGVSTLTQQREEMETTANSTAAEVEELKEKLKASRETYEREQKLVQDLSIKAGDQKKELQEARQELIRAESELSGLKVERAEAEGSLMRDKEEIRMLKGKLAEINQQTNEIRVALEKFKKDGRQQKGMLAISKKQVATAEADQQKTTQELEQLKLGDVSTEIEPAQAPDTRSPPGSSSAPLPPFSQGPSQAASPAGSAKSTNPFDRFMSKSMSPQATGGSHISSGKPSPFSQPSALPAAAAIGGAALAGTHATQDLEGSKPPPAHPSKDASDDPFAPSSQAAVQTSSDPFGGSTEPVAGNAPTFAASFDDNFEQSFTSPAPVTSPAGQPQGAFDDTAFDGFDKAATTSELQEAGAPTSKEGSSDKRFPPLEEPGSEVSSSRAAVEEKGDDSSGDEDDGPEDLDNPRSNTRTPQLPGAFTEEGRSSVPKTDPLPVVGTASATPVDHQASKGRPVSNDFDSDFVDLAPSTTSAPGVSQEDDKFGDDFNFDDFGSNDEHPIGKPQSQTAVSAASPQFDDAFGDDTFNPAASSAKPAHKNGDAFGSDFDDAFDASSAAASASAVPAVSPGLPSDPPAVQELTAMGFSRTEVTDVLKAHGNDQERALNALLDKKE